MIFDMTEMKPAEIAASLVKGRKEVEAIRAKSNDNQPRLRFRDCVVHVYGKYGLRKAIEVAQNLSPVPLSRDFCHAEIMRYLKFLKSEKRNEPDFKSNSF